MTANAWQVFDVFYEQLANEAHDLNGTDVIKMALHTSSWSPNLQTDVSQSALGNEHANGNGYTTGGVVVAATWDAATNTLTFDVADGAWTASGGSIVARYAVLYNDDAPGSINDLIAYCLLDNTPADVTATAGNGFTVEIHASGVFTIAQS